LLVADFPQMNFTQMHERLRLELLRRIQRGTLSVSLLARKTGFGESHLSNFLHCKRQLSLQALDRVLAAENLAVADLLPALDHVHFADQEGESSAVPIVSHHTALFEPNIRPSATVGFLQLQPGTLEALHARVTPSRRAWQRFVAIRVNVADALAMDPVLLPDAVVVLDRHYATLSQYRPDRQNLYAVKHEAHLMIRYVELIADRLVLRPHNLGFPSNVLEVDRDESLSDVIVGRVAMIVNEM
jgi:hypothetical protein